MTDQTPETGITPEDRTIGELLVLVGQWLDRLGNQPRLYVTFADPRGRPADLPAGSVPLVDVQVSSTTDVAFEGRVAEVEKIAAAMSDVRDNSSENFVSRIGRIRGGEWVQVYTSTPSYDDTSDAE